MKKIALMILLLSFMLVGVVFAEEITSADYTVITPEGLTITQNGWNPAEGITASSDRWIKITVTASTDSKLTSDRGHTIHYTLTSRDNGAPVRVWEFSPDELHVPGGTTKPVGAMIDLSTARPGNYTTNLIYTVSADELDVVDLSTITGAYTAQDWVVLTGTAGADAHIMIAAGATVILSDADITSIPSYDSHKWAGITCSGDATIILDGTNKVKGGYEWYPGIFISPGYTLTIKGTGSLMAESGGSDDGVGAGIGSGYQIACGNIVIEGGTITANGGSEAAGIGSGGGASCGNIEITGGTIEATGGWGAAGIGSGQWSSCGTIEITSGVTSVTATKGSSSPNSIGAGNNGTCDGVTIGDTEYSSGITTSPYTYQP